MTDRWKLAVSGTYLNFPVGEKSKEWRVAAQQRYTLSQNLALRLDFNQRPRIQEVLLNLHTYF